MLSALLVDQLRWDILSRSSAESVDSLRENLLARDSAHVSRGKVSKCSKAMPPSGFNRESIPQ